MNEIDLEQALQREQQRAIELAYLYQISLDLMAQPSGSISDTARLILDNALLLLRCLHCCILLWGEQDGQWQPIYSATAEAAPNAFWPHADFCDDVWTQQRAIVRNSPDGSSNLGVKFTLKEAPIGIITAHRPPDSTPFSDDEIQLITLLASLSASMISNVQLQRDLNERVELLQTVMAASPSGLVVIENGRLLMANPAALQALRLYQTDFDLALEVDSPDGFLLERLREAQNSDDPAFEYRVISAANETRYLQVAVVSVGEDRILAQVNDITLLREVESRREQAVAYTSHELKTPLAVMNLGLSNLLSYYERMPDEERRVMIEETLEQVNEMKGLITGLLDPSKRKPRKAVFAEPALTPDPLGVIKTVLTDLTPLAQVNQIALFWEPETERITPSARITPQDLKTIARNLISNAIKYTGQGGQVRVTTTSSEAGFVVAVSDTGVGIPAHELSHIFEARFRASTRGKVEGNGLGLSIVRDLVNQAHGTIHVQSTVAVGTLFVVTLPIP